MKIFVLMVQFLTRIPINIEIEVNKEDFSKGIVYFPLVGLLVGFVNAFFYVIISKVIEGWLPLIAVVASNILVTGALHLDGLADSADGLFSSRKKERMLEIMKDSRIGTNGALALILSILIKIVLLDITPEAIIIPIIILMPVVGRGAMSIILYKSKYAREEGLGDLFIGKTSLGKTLISAFMTFVLVYITLGNLGLLAALVAILGAYLLREYFSKKLGGLTGDILGAINEIVELAFSFGIVVLWGYL